MIGATSIPKSSGSKRLVGAKAPARSRSRAKPKTPTMSEDAIHRAVVQHLHWRGRPDVFWFHPPNGGHRDKVTAARMKGLGVVPGVPDIVLVIAGRAYGLELKADRGRPSPAQIAAHAQMRGSGAVIEMTYGLDEALAVLGRWGALREATS